MGGKGSFADGFNSLRYDGPDERGVLIVTMDSGRPGNLMTAELHADLARLWTVLAARSGVRAVLIRGADGFCAGSDTELIEGTAWSTADELATLLEEARAIILGALSLELPLVAAVRGAAVGAALGLALTADICVVADDARLSDGHSRIGVPAGDHAVLLWPMLCGMAMAKRHLLIPDALTGMRAREIGLVSECVPDAEVDAHADGLAGRLAAQAPLSVRWTKRALAHWFRLALPAFESSLAHELLAYGTADAREGARSLTEHRRPNFDGAL